MPPVQREPAPPCPKIELHVHLEGTLRPHTLLEMARRNGVALPTQTVEGLAELYRYRDVARFIQVWIMTTNAMRRAEDFCQVVVDYAAAAAAHGAVYLEGIFSPAERARRGVPWAEVVGGYCDGAQAAHERYGVEVRLTPEVTRDLPLEDALLTARHAVAYRERGVVALGLGGDELRYPPEAYAPAFRLARDGGLGSVPHAGEGAGPASIRGALDALGADRLRHGIRAVEDPALVRDLAGRGVVLDVCLFSNLRTGVVPSRAAHPLPALVAAGVRCSPSTNDPAMFETDLAREYAATGALGVPERTLFQAGLAGALCDAPTRERLRAIGTSFAWPPRSRRRPLG